MTKSLATQIKEAQRQEARLEQAAAVPSRSDVPVVETIRLINGWRITRTDKPGARWMLWHPGDPAGLGRRYYARVIELDWHGLYGETLVGELKYETLTCAHHERVEGHQTERLEELRTAFMQKPHCKWCGESWDRIEERRARAGGSDAAAG